MRDVFRLDPNRKWIISISGGRTSAFLLRRILDAYRGTLPEHARVAFANTGRERPETLDFVAEIQKRWNVDIAWLEFRYRRKAKGGIKDRRFAWVEVDRRTASLDGLPFEDLIGAKKMLPNPVMRFCTSELKVNPIRRWAFDRLGWKRPINVIGIRADESRRISKALMEECKTYYPLALAGIRRGDIDRFWKAQPFDLGIDSRFGNCDLCFLKGGALLAETIRRDPERVEWWQRQEHKTQKLLRKQEMVRFHKAWSYEDLAGMAKSGGRQLELLPAAGIDCFCGD